MSALPTQVQAQADEADRIEAEILAAQGVNVAQQEPEQESPPVDVEQSDVRAEEQVARQESQDDETWQKRYLTLQGMFNAEVPRLNGRIKDLEGQLQSAIQQFKEASTSPQQPEKTEAKRLITTQDEEAFGSDLLDVVKRQAQEVLNVERNQFQQMLDELRAENAKLNQQLGNVSERQGANDRKTYLATLEQQVPGFEQINTDQQFLSWLSETDPMTGLSRRAYLEDAYSAFDVNRTAAIFNSWPGAKSVQAKPSPKSELAKQVAPSATRNASPPTAPNNRIWSSAEIDEFYREVSKGHYRHREADAQRIEAEIDLAVAEGRLRP